MQISYLSSKLAVFGAGPLQGERCNEIPAATKGLKFPGRPRARKQPAPRGPRETVSGGPGWACNGSTIAKDTCLSLYMLLHIVCI